MFFLFGRKILWCDTIIDFQVDYPWNAQVSVDTFKLGFRQFKDKIFMSKYQP